MIRRILSRFRRRRPEPRSVMPLEADDQAAQILLHVAEDVVAALEVTTHDSEEAAELAVAAVDTLEGLSVEELFPSCKPAASPEILEGFFALLASLPEDTVGGLVEQHQLADPELAALIRYVGPGIVAKIAARHVRETEQLITREALRRFRAAIAAHLVDSELDNASALVLSEAVPRLRERIEAAP